MKSILVEDELDKFNITDAKSLIKKMETGGLSKSTNNLNEMSSEKKPEFKNKVKKISDKVAEKRKDGAPSHTAKLTKAAELE